MKSLLFRVFMTVLEAFFAISNLSPYIEPDVSIKMIIFLEADIAETYQGLYLGS